MKIEVKDFNLYYGDFHALKNISMGMPEHAVSALIGPSGCGKSTLLKSLNRMNDLVPGVRIEGLAALDGEDIYGNVDVNDLRRRVGMVFQKPNPFPMSVYDNIAYGPRTHGVRSRSESKGALRRPPYGTSSRTGSRRARWRFRAASSSACA